MPINHKIIAYFVVFLYHEFKENGTEPMRLKGHGATTPKRANAAAEAAIRPFGGADRRQTTATPMDD